MFQEQEVEFDLRVYLYTISKWRWVILAVFVLAIFIGTIYSIRQPPIYRATARIMIEKESPNIPFAEEAFAWMSWDYDYLNSQYEILRSRALAKLVSQKLGMTDQPVVNEQLEKKRFSLHQYIDQLSELLGVQEAPLSEAAQDAAQEQQLVGAVLGMISVVPVKESRLVDISATSTDRDHTALVTNTLVETYIEQNLEAKVAASKDAVQWLVKELEIIQKKLADSKLAVQEYKKQHTVVSFTERQNSVIQELSSLVTAANNARIQRISIEAQYRKIQEYGTSIIKTLPQVVNNSLIQQLSITLLNLEAELSKLEKKFRAGHPTIIALRAQISSQQHRIDAEMQRVIESITRQYEIAHAQENELIKDVARQKQDALELNQKAITYEVLEQEMESNQRIYEALLTKMNETSTSERLATSNIRIVDRATIPRFPIAPMRKRTILLAMMTGLVIGVSLAFLLEYFDSSVRTPEDIKQYLDIPFLGIVPKMSSQVFTPEELKGVMEKIVAVAPSSMESEAYRIVRTNLTFSTLYENYLSHERGPVLLVTSAGPAEGKSCTAANLGIALAQSGRRTLIIDADFRKPVMHKIFNLSIGNGFTDMIANLETHKATQCIHQTDVSNLSVIPCGKIPHNPSELLGSSVTTMIIKELGQKFDNILIDSPPINVVADPIILSRIARGVMMVILADKTKREVVQRATEQLRSVDATILGGVLNNVDLRKNRYYYYKYHYQYYYREPEKLTG